MDIKKLFSEAMYRLLHNNPVERITVEMVLAESGLSRSTFYRHFEDKYDLMNYYYQSYLETLQIEVEPGGWEKLIYTVLLFLQKNRQYFLNAHKTEGPNSHLSFLQQYSIASTEKAYMQNSRKSELSDEERIAITYTCGGSIAVMRTWMDEGMRQNPRDIASLIYSNMPQILKTYLV